MAQIRDINKRIKSIKNTQKVTHAMELVAAAKMRKAQMRALSSRPYSMHLNEILDQVRANTKFRDRLFMANNAQSEMIILVTSDRGLAGGLNINLFREIIALDAKNPVFLTVGKKALSFAAKAKGEILASFESEEKPQIELAKLITKLAIDNFLEGRVAKVTLLYPHFESAIKQPPRWIQILPIDPGKLFGDGPQKESADSFKDTVLFEPGASQILKKILPHYASTQIYQVLVEATASEHSARMVAMKNATDAAGDLIDNLTLTFNQARQEAITKELLDITTAQRAFK